MNDDHDGMTKGKGMGRESEKRAWEFLQGVRSTRNTLQIRFYRHIRSGGPFVYLFEWTENRYFYLMQMIVLNPRPSKF